MPNLQDPALYQFSALKPCPIFRVSSLSLFLFTCGVKRALCFHAGGADAYSELREAALDSASRVFLTDTLFRVRWPPTLMFPFAPFPMFFSRS